MANAGPGIGGRLPVADTIVALASGGLPAGVAVIRLSGPAVRRVAAAMLGVVPVARRASLRAVKDSKGELIDRALVLLFEGPSSFTGEDVLEIHCHGSRAVVDAVVGAALEVEGVRLAEPGEFTRRAFDHGKLDLSAAEGLADLIDAETEGQRRQALRQMDGGLARAVEAIREKLLEAVAFGEAQIDFPDEDIPDGLGPVLGGAIGQAQAMCQRLMDGARTARRVRDGFRIAIVGAPNAGKSSLLNCLAQSDVAIVSPVAGTTRDVLEVRIKLAGHLVLLSDTAGMRDSDDVVEAEGVRRAEARAREADLRLLVSDSLDGFSVLGAFEQSGDLRVWSKADLRGQGGAPEGVLSLSSLSGDGTGPLIDALSARLRQAPSQEESGLTRLRHVEALSECLVCLQRALVSDPSQIELVVEELRLAARALGRVTGRIGVEDVLDAVFSQFCIGK